MEHRLLLIRAAVDDHGAMGATVLGHTGNVYDASLGPRVRCSCPDFVKTGQTCKHLLFVFLRVLQVPRDDHRVWQRSLLPDELRDLRERLKGTGDAPGAAEVQASDAVVFAHDAAGGAPLRRPPGEPCPICFDPVHAVAGAACCASCGRNFHRECVAQCQGAAAAEPPACQVCGAEWAGEEIAAAAARTPPGRPLPWTINLAAHSEAHAAPMTLEQSYPETHMWIARWESAAGGGQGPTDQV